MDFIILKVNGVDVSSFPYEDAVRAFLTADEPVVVEVKRRINESTTSEVRTTNTKYKSASCQTDISGVQWIEDNSLDYLTHDIDLEEVTLRKCSSDEKLGLTVCYSSGSEADTCTEVYIRDIAPESVADRDGRLRQGDQILQVNGKDVANKEETESLFAENRKAVTLLVSRCYTYSRSEEYLDSESEEAVSPAGQNITYQNSLRDQLVDQQNEYQHSPKNENSPKTPSHFAPDKLNLTNSLVRSKIDSINQEISQLDFRMQNIQLIKSDKRKLPNILVPPESDTEHIYETIPEDCITDSELEPIYSCPYEPGDDNLMIEQWLKIHQQESAWGSSSTDFSKFVKDTKKLKSKPTKSNSSAEEQENSSSAYNTGGSCNSNNPLTFELAALQDSKHKNVYRSTLILHQLNKTEEIPKEKEVTGTTCESCKRQVTAKAKKSKSDNKIISPSSHTRNMAALSPAHMLSDTMYTNVANLQQTILLQQQLFREAMVQQNSEVMPKPTTSFISPSLSRYQIVSNELDPYMLQHDQQKESSETKIEWKVKRRPDGTRYIARRPVSSKILKNRELRITEERAGLTTEDDTVSTLKIGRYWTKEERKKHLEKSRERKQRQEILMASRNSDETITDQNRDKVSLSRKNTMSFDNTAKKYKKNKNRTYKDGRENFPTVPGMLVHGPKVPSSTSKMVGLLSVTTV